MMIPLDPSELPQIYSDLRALAGAITELSAAIDLLLPPAMKSGITLLVEESDIQPFR